MLVFLIHSKNSCWKINPLLRSITLILLKVVYIFHARYQASKMHTYKMRCQNAKTLQKGESGLLCHVPGCGPSAGSSRKTIRHTGGRVKLCSTKVCSTKDYYIWSITALGARTLVHHTISHGDTLHIAPLTPVLYGHCLLL